MYPHWTELRSDGRERLQRYIAEADEYRLARRTTAARPTGPSLMQMLAAALRRVTPAWRGRQIAAAATR